LKSLDNAYLISHFEKSNVTLTLTRDILPVDTADVTKNNIFLSQC